MTLERKLSDLSIYTARCMIQSILIGSTPYDIASCLLVPTEDGNTVLGYQLVRSELVPTLIMDVIERRLRGLGVCIKADSYLDAWIKGSSLLIYYNTNPIPATSLLGVEHEA